MTSMAGAAPARRKPLSKLIESPDNPALSDLCQQLAAHSNALDAVGDWPEQQLAWCREHGVQRWFFGPEWGGAGWSESDLARAWMQLGGACLSTAFVLTQPAGAGRRIADCDNGALRQRMLPRLARGECYASVGISHLTTSRRHVAQPTMQARQAGDRLVLDGVIPWVTGARQAEIIVTGAQLADGRQILVALPTAAPGVTIPPPAAMVGLTSTQTGEVHCNNVEVGREWLMAGPVDNVLAQSAGGAKTGGVQTSALALGLAGAAIEFLAQEAERRPDLAEACASLRRERQDLASELLAAAQGAPISLEQLRVRANSLVLRAPHAALTAAKGAGFVQGHPVGRWCRESLFFLVWSCPQPVAAAALCELAGL